ncbi:MULTISPECIES: cobalamin B12-binding domain-containing protein [Rhodopseudomonas]|uniref:Cobalamin-binding protein n=1 Tax=Rhodopseudomonas palustris TaxID=1076 RepID=A0A0D7F5Q3_RHOPL|nr:MULTISPECIES: cobalamin B12-binding domain-containing protein [Rhodopseudomonas]KIZ47042.1 cobalamin-binding protein [Rhodopseudomonas palustris]MDF3813371.1 cobalamin B12-binding domain-containing protein [Rhodopseudomonas sp. BAL398]WOK20382.1 cobalamin B12-binding domain-containing protein [Rhodopseudomonas sp. BAL398]
MGDLHDHAQLADITQDGGIPSSRPGRAFPEPIWRLHPPLSATGMVRALKTQIIPKIALALRTRPSRQDEMPPDQHLASNDQPLTTELEEFVSLVLGNDEDAARAYVESLRARGESTDSILLNLLAPVARQLGEMWETDHTDFANVTLGVSRMQRIMRQLSESFSQPDHAIGGGSLLLTTIPGEQHSFGMSMVAEFFRREGWNIAIGPFASHLELTSLVQERWFDVVGFSITSDRRLDELKRDIQTIRRDSRNRHVAIMIGGPMVARLPELGTAMGADMTSVDASTAPRQARELVMVMKKDHS